MTTHITTQCDASETEKIGVAGPPYVLVTIDSLNDFVINGESRSQ